MRWYNLSFKRREERVITRVVMEHSFGIFGFTLGLERMTNVCGIEKVLLEGW